jgi:hypothetical protein
MNYKIIEEERKDENGQKTLSSFLYRQFLKEQKKDFEIKETGYSTEIVEGENKFLFAERFANFQFFVLLNKLKAEIKKSNIIIDEIDKTNIDYFGIKENLKLSIKKIRDKKNNNFFLNIDIKSAYLTALRNENIISEEFFEEVNKCKKSERLRLLGSLATTKNIYKYKNGELVFLDQKKSDLENYFWFCCLEIGDLMQKISTKLENNFLFFWVDGIYSLYNSSMDLIIEELNKNNYLFSFDICRLKTFEENEESFKFEFWKLGDKKCTLKTFNLPKENLTSLKRTYFYSEKKNLIN